MNTQNTQVTPLDASFEQNGQRLVQIKRNDKAAIYRRETLDGTIVSYEVFAVKSKNGKEIYPNQGSLRKWLWNGMNLDKITQTFNDITAGDVCVWNCDPETNEVIQEENDPSLDELLEDMADVNPPIVQTPVVAESIPVVVETPVAVETPANTEKYVEVVNLDNAPVVESPVIDVVSIPVTAGPPIVEPPATIQVQPAVNNPVTVNTNGSATVVVAKVKKPKNTNKTQIQYVFPTGEWLRDDFAKLNNMCGPWVTDGRRQKISSDSYGPLMALVKQGKVKEIRKENRPGYPRPRSIYTTIS